MRFRKSSTAVLAASALLIPVAGIAQDPFELPGVGSGEPVKASLVAEQDAIVPGQTFTVSLNLKHDAHWHTYWRNGGFPAQPTTIKWELPEGFKETRSLWPIPKIVKSEVGTQHSLDGDIHILTDFTAPSTVKAGDKIKLKASVSWLQCQEDKCVQGGKELELVLPVADKAAKVPAEAAAFDAVRKAQPEPVPAWKVAVTEKGNSWEVRAEPGEGASADPGDLHFFDAATAISTDNQEWKAEGTARVLTMAKEKEDSKTKPWGFIQASKSWVTGGDVKILPVGSAPDPSAVPEQSDVPEKVPGTGAGGNPKTAGSASGGNVDEMVATIYSWGVRPLGGKTEDPPTAWGAILLALAGGLVLNLMPCVFPVLGIKILGFVRQSGEDKAVVRKHGIVYALGVIASMIVLMSVLLIVRKSSEAAGWGFQFQNPVFLAFLIVIVFVFSLNLAGLFELGTSLTSVGAELQNESGYRGSFFSGLLTVLLATPCTGPLMGTALGFALNKDTPTWLVIAVFIALSIGLALPYVLLSWYPALVKKLPRPGPWMETFKQFMAFPMFATVVWLITVFESSTGSSGVAWLLFALVFFAMALWLYGRFGNPMAKPKSKRFALSVAALCVLAGGWCTWDATNEVSNAVEIAKEEVPLSAETIIARRANGQITVVDFWAKWCLQCQLNKKAAFDREDFKKKLPEYDAIFMLGDQTKSNPLAEKFLKAYQSGGIPYALVIPPTGPAIQLPQVIASPDTLIEALEEAKKQANEGKKAVTKNS